MNCAACYTARSYITTGCLDELAAVTCVPSRRIMPRVAMVQAAIQGATGVTGIADSASCSEECQDALPRCPGAGAGSSSCFGLGSGLHRLSHLCSAVACHWRRVSFVLVLRCFGCLSSHAPSGTLMLMLSLGLCSLLPPAPAHGAPLLFLQRAEALPSRWRFLRAWDSSLGFPGEGPRQPALSSAKRAGVDPTSRNLSYETLEKRRKMLDEFGEVLDSRYGLSVDTLT